MFPIIDAVPRPLVSGRVRGTLGYAFGLGLMLLSLVASLPAVLLVVLATLLALDQNDSWGSPFDWEPTLVLVSIGGLVIAGVCSLVGVRLLRRRRYLALFLRRFGFTPSTAALSFAVSKRLGAAWRVVTLDDQQVSAMGVTRSRRWSMAIARLFLLAVLALSVYLASVLVSEGTDNPALSVLFYPVMIVPVAAAFALFLTFALRSVRDAERSKAVVISTPGEMERELSRVRRRTRRVFAPRLVVLKVASPLWQEVVRRLAATCDAVIVDISESSENLLWEVRTLDAEGTAWVALGQLDRLSQLQTADSRFAQELVSALRGRPVLAYAPDRLRQFGSELRNSLDAG